MPPPRLPTPAPVLQHAALLLAALPVGFACASPAHGAPDVATAGEDEAEPAPAPTHGGAGPTCGRERWSVKVGTDKDAARVDVARPLRATIAELRALPWPDERVPFHASLPPVRVGPHEVRAHALDDVTLVCFKREPDGDLHLVLADGDGATMIAEIPDPACAAGSPFVAAITRARAAFEAGVRSAPPARGCAPVGEVVSVRGVVFFDRVHGQRGVAPNGVELHPVLDLCFGRGCAR